ncbi:hypothetical protein WDU94_012144 [Cyamophila willieti]
MLEKNVRYAHVSQVLILCWRKMFATLTCHIPFLRYPVYKLQKRQKRPFFGPGDKTV